MNFFLMKGLYVSVSVFFTLILVLQYASEKNYLAPFSNKQGLFL